MHLKFNNQFSKTMKLFIVFSGLNSLHSNEISKYSKDCFFDYSEIKELQFPIFYISQIEKLVTQNSPNIEDTIANLKRNYDKEFVKFIINNKLNPEVPILTDIEHEGLSLCRPYSYLFIVNTKQSMKVPVIKDLTLGGLRLCRPESYLLYIAVYNFLEKLKELGRKINTPEVSQLKNEKRLLCEAFVDEETKRIKDGAKVSKKLSKERGEILKEFDECDAKFIKRQINFILYLLRRAFPDDSFRKRFLVHTIINYFAKQLGYHLACVDFEIEYFGKVENVEKVDPLVRQALRDLITQEVKQIFAKEEDNPDAGAWMINF